MSSFDIKVVGLDKLIQKLGRAVAQETLEQPMLQGAHNIASWSKKNRLSGPRPQFLGVGKLNGGRLRSSIAVSRSISRSEFKFFIGTNVKYARIHEFGGIIRPKTKGFLAWRNPDTGKWIFTKKPVVIPARPFLRPALENKENQKLVVNLVTAAINKALKE